MILQQQASDGPQRGLPSDRVVQKKKKVLEDLREKLQLPVLPRAGLSVFVEKPPDLGIS